MKNTRTPFFVLLPAIFLAAVFFQSCSSNQNSSNPSAPVTVVLQAPTATPTQPIVWDYCVFSGSSAAATGTGQLKLSVNGNPESTDGVTLVGPGFGGPSNALTFAGATVDITNNRNCGYYFTSGTFIYVAGTKYVLTTVTSAGTAAVTFTAPGGSVSISSNGTTITWNTEGNSDYVTVYDYLNPTMFYNSADATPDINSPFLVPAAVYSVYGSPATFTVSMYPTDTETPTNASGTAVMYETEGIGIRVIR